MMRRDDKALREILKVRRAQSAAADLRAVRATATRQAEEERRSVQATVLVEQQRRWAEALAGDRFALEAALGWASVVQASQADQRRIEQALVEAESLEAERRRERADARARTECAADLTRSETRRAAREREELALNEMADRDLARRKA